ncbi:MAG: bacillithiol biosynthesis cysteine-adding enzyme BshC, partial [Acidobacteria bacterium]
MKAEYLDYRRIPGQNPIFLRYLYEFESVADWYPAGQPDATTLARRAHQLLRSGREYPREALVASLDRFNRLVGSGQPALENIQTLRQSSTVAVVTGQQVGLFGGPALAVHKALTAISLARQLEQDGVRAVPVFWLASDDSDYAEVAAARLLAADGELLTVAHPGPVENGNRTVGSVRLTGVEDLLEDVGARTAQGEFRRPVLENLRKTYASGRTFSEAFGALMAALFQEQGLVLYDALTARLKGTLTEAYSTAIRRRDDIIGELRKRSEQLQKTGLTPQVQVPEDETLLFLFRGDRRYKMSCLDGGYRTREGSSQDFSEEELLSLGRREPEALGPNVLLRPILQDHLFPTVAYVAGPAETAYFAQISAIAGFWGVEPAVFPRVGVTLIDAKVKRLFQKYRIGLEDILGGSPQETLHRLAKDSAAGELIRSFEGLHGSVETQAGQIEGRLEPI